MTFTRPQRRGLLSPLPRATPPRKGEVRQRIVFCPLCHGRLSPQGVGIPCPPYQGHHSFEERRSASGLTLLSVFSGRASCPLKVQ